MKLSQIAPMRWYRQVNLWAMNLSPWRYSALMASGIASGSDLGQWLAGTDRSLAERFLLIGSSWLIALLIGRLLAPAALQTMRQQQQWREERRQGHVGEPRR